MSSESRPRIAIIGAGISGLAAAWLLRDRYEITLYEAQARAGGHADTQHLALDGEPIAVDTGFIVFNDRNYPNLTGFFAELGIESQPSTMSFSVFRKDGSFEYAGGALHQLFAQPSNILKPGFWWMLREVLRFNRDAPALLRETGHRSLGDYLQENRYGSRFVHDYILPMGAAIWSASIDSVREFPAVSFVRFFQNHGLLGLNRRPHWRTVVGGSKIYVDRVLRDLRANTRLASEVVRVRRLAAGVSVETARDTAGQAAVFSQIVFACPADTALALIDDPTPREAALLGAFRFQDNIAVLHQDTACMPRRRRAWSAWNYFNQGGDFSKAICLTYWMNLLQGLRTRLPLLVSINPQADLDGEKILRRRPYRHPQFDAAAIEAQEHLQEIQGTERYWFAGAWTGWGFHEDGIVSAVRIANALGVRAPWQGA